MLSTAAIILAASLPLPSTPADAVRAALADAKQLPIEARPYTRYLSLYAVPQSERTDYLRWFTFWAWSLSREAEPGKPRRVTRDLVAIDLRDYGWDPFVYGRLAAVDPYFHVSTTIDGKTAKDAGLYAPWLPPAETAQLALLLGPSPGVTCQTAILRLDWWVYWTSIQDQRGGAGYYDFLGITDRASFESLIGLDPKLAAQRKAEHRAIVEHSGVSHFPRQVLRLVSTDGGAWRTLDVLDDARGARNPIRRLDRDYQHQAEEHYGIGPSGLFVFLLCDQDGKLQDAAPDKIGPDKTRLGHNRTRIEVGASCVRCHLEGLRPVSNWMRDVIQSPTTANVDAERARRLRVYFRDLESKLKADNAAYATRLKECNGLTPAQNAKLFARLWDRYEAPLTLADCARELGATLAVFERALLEVKSAGKLDPAFAGLVARVPRPIRREQWEEAFPLAMQYMGGKP